MMVSQALDTLTNMSATAKLQKLDNLHIINTVNMVQIQNGLCNG